MKQNPQLKKAYENMKPGVITLQGLIGDDRRDLIQILDEDDATVKDLGLTHEEIAERMKELRDAGKPGLEEFIDVAPHFEVRVSSVRGKLRCPFEDPGLIPKYNTTVKNLSTGKEITYTDLNIHLIEKHAFYQGKGSSFRLNPAELVEIIEAKKEE